MTDDVIDSQILLLQAVGQGDRRAFEQLYRQHSSYLFAIALRMLRRRGWAEEVLHDTMLAIWQRAATYDPTLSAPKTWMTTFIRHRAIDYLRLKANQVTPLETLDVARMEEAEGLACTFADALPSTSEARRLAGCLENLPGEQRQSVMLAYYQGLSHSEISAHMEQPAGTVKSWIRRALAHLKECVGI
ncbi:sigma-70 family RNA polymerase sigma factor [Erwinia sp. MMLR14_017]|uniref:RNA polymerase sigma factor n=1 Tax=Erwinia sp. MMLR14_017 TaxID=3093842 RepID=UPI0029905BBA|nr:sigma-70 family RNA polymerase sigma factor [Erwinia sp. MMLR14_017]MDW8844761.1 sigma-70 family RNA polymerase sigma factor [Erwinia sp. MMLR14_017]